MNKQRYRGKNGILIWSCLLACNGLLCWVWINGSVHVAWLLGIFMGINLIFVPIIVRNRVELTAESLVLYYGFSKYEFSLTKLKTMKKTHTPLGGCANAIDRIYLDFGGEDLIIALQNNDAFMNDVNQRRKKDA